MTTNSLTTTTVPVTSVRCGDVIKVNSFPFTALAVEARAYGICVTGMHSDGYLQSRLYQPTVTVERVTDAEVAS